MTSTELDNNSKRLAIRCIQLMAEGTQTDFEACIRADAYNHESVQEPAACRGRGPTAFFATAQWLREAFTDLAFQIHQVAADGGLVAMRTTMSGRHTGVFVTYDADARPAQAFPPTGKAFSVTHTHWCRMVDGMLVEHWANRDDLQMSMQLGWNPPSPGYILRMQIATLRARRRAHRAAAH